MPTFLSRKLLSMAAPLSWKAKTATALLSLLPSCCLFNLCLFEQRKEGGDGEGGDGEEAESPFRVEGMEGLQVETNSQPRRLPPPRSQQPPQSPLLSVTPWRRTDTPTRPTGACPDSCNYDYNSSLHFITPFIFNSSFLLKNFIWVFRFTISQV